VLGEWGNEQGKNTLEFRSIGFGEGIVNERENEEEEFL
jgi:hypothetical protein